MSKSKKASKRKDDRPSREKLWKRVKKLEKEMRHNTRKDESAFSEKETAEIRARAVSADNFFFSLS